MSRQKQKEIDTVKKTVRLRDGHRCVKCRMTSTEHIEWCGRELDVHRVNPGSLYKEELCITVCKKCHGKEARRAKGVVDLARPGKFVELPRDVAEELKAMAERYGTNFTHELVDAARRHIAYPPERKPEPLPDAPKPARKSRK